MLNVPLLATDPYGNFTPGPNGYPQIVTTGGGLVEGTAAGTPIPADVVRTGHAFLDDIAHHAVPRGDQPEHGPGPVVDLAPDGNSGTTTTTTPRRTTTRCSTRTSSPATAGPTRTSASPRSTTSSTPSTTASWRTSRRSSTRLETPENIADWHDSAGPAWSYGQRLFQAARFVTEMEYQHLVFEEFARKIQPMVNLFGEAGVGYHTEIDPSIRAEFAHTVYRFGHSMLSEVVPRRSPLGRQHGHRR